MSSETVLEKHARAERLRRAAEEILAPDMDPGRERDIVLSLVGMAAHRLESDHELRLCLRCRREYSFDPRSYVSRGLQLPKYCYGCRRDRREERDRAIGAGAVVPER